MLRPLVLILALLLPAGAFAAPWKIDPSTTVAVDVGWKGSTVTVKFPSISGTIDFDQTTPDRARAEIQVATADATTGVPVVDLLVRGPDYLAAGQWPAITFHLDKLTQTSKSTARASGRITMRGVTRPETFDATVFRFGPAKDDPHRFEAGFDILGSIDRTAFGSTAGAPDVSSVLPVRIHLLMTSS